MCTYLILVGVNGANNQVLITDGGRLFSTAGAGQVNILGVNSATVTNNTVRITGRDSLWQVASGGRLLVGSDGAGAVGSGKVLVESTAAAKQVYASS